MKYTCQYKEMIKFIPGIHNKKCLMETTYYKSGTPKQQLEDRFAMLPEIKLKKRVEVDFKYPPKPYVPVMTKEQDKEAQRKAQNLVDAQIHDCYKNGRSKV